MKFWDLDSAERNKPGGGDEQQQQTISPTCTRTIKVQHGGKPYPVSTFAVLENMSQLAIGLANGVVILIRGDLFKDRTTKQKVIYEGQEPITGKLQFSGGWIPLERTSKMRHRSTGLGFREQTKSTILFIVTTTSIMSYNTTANKPTVASTR